MSILTTVYRVLREDATLNGLLARHKLTKTAPAIYEQWAAEGTEKPYINLTFRFDISDHWAKRDCTVNIDIFTAGDTMQAELIRNNVIKILDRQTLLDPDDGDVRCYLNNDTLLDEDTPEIAHWNIEMSALFWRSNFVGYLND